MLGTTPHGQRGLVDGATKRSSPSGQAAAQSNAPQLLWGGGLPVHSPSCQLCHCFPMSGVAQVSTGVRCPTWRGCGGWEDSRALGTWPDKAPPPHTEKTFIPSTSASGNLNTSGPLEYRKLLQLHLPPSTLPYLRIAGGNAPQSLEKLSLIVLTLEFFPGLRQPAVIAREHRERSRSRTAPTSPTLRQADMSACSGEVGAQNVRGQGWQACRWRRSRAPFLPLSASFLLSASGTSPPPPPTFLSAWHHLDCCCCSVALSCPTLCNPMDCSMPGFPVHHRLLEPAQTHVIESVMPSNHFILCRPLLLLSSIFPSIRVFSNESAPG